MLNQKEYEKEIENLGKKDKKILSKIFGSATRKVEEIGAKFAEMDKKAKAKVAKKVGVVALAILIGAGMTACKEETKEPVQITNTANEYEETTEKETNPAETSGNENQGGSQGGSQGGNENQGGSQGGSQGGTETPGGSQGGNENQGGTETPGGSQGGNENQGGSQGGTETPGGSQGGEDSSTDQENNDMPGDADGFKYADKVWQTLHNAIVNDRALEDIEKKHNISLITPEILFMEVGTATEKNKAPVYVYAKYTLFNGDVVYTKFEYRVGASLHRSLLEPSLFANYSEFASRMADGVEGGIYVGAEESESHNFHNMTEAQTTKLAQIIDEKFVDVDLSFVSGLIRVGDIRYREFCGFGYDELGNSYSFISQIKEPGTVRSLDDFLVKVGNSTFTKENIEYINTTSARIDSVFAAEAQAE